MTLGTVALGACQAAGAVVGACIGGGLALALASRLILRRARTTAAE